jgi:ABC-type antimicrobial peptide transport system permease subunit
LNAAASIREAVRSLDPNLPVVNVITQEEQISRSFTTERTFAVAAVFFGVTALVLACIGLFGLMSYSVERRTTEIGIRVALGAKPFDVVLLMMSQTLVLVLLGTTIGIAASFGVNRVIGKMLFRVAPTDAVTMGFAAITMLLIACAAAYWPVRRAARLNPTTALRVE